MAGIPGLLFAITFSIAVRHRTRKSEIQNEMSCLCFFFNRTSQLFLWLSEMILVLLGLCCSCH